MNLLPLLAFLFGTAYGFLGQEFIVNINDNELNQDFDEYGTVLKVLRVGKSYTALLVRSTHIDCANKLRVFDGVNSVHPNSQIHIMKEEVIENPASWGLDRISQDDLPLDDTYRLRYDGTGVDAYVVDTGIYAEHNFFEGRAEVVEVDFVGDGQYEDCNGHGSHCSGTIGGSRDSKVGVAPGVHLYGLRVLDCRGSGSLSGVIEGIGWAVENAQKTGRPSVISMSLGVQAISNPIIDATNAAVVEGVVVVVAAGNSLADSCKFSPAAAEGAITVGASDINDDFAYFSNWGKCMDIVAPGVDITSVWLGSPDAVNSISGTSMSCPHVSGAVALLLSENPNLTPQEVKDLLIKNAGVDKLSINFPNTANSLLRVNKHNMPRERVVEAY